MSVMGKIDGNSYPDISPETAEDIADKLVNTFGGEPSSENAFAQEIGHKSADSGAYRGKIADVRRYGLLPSRGLEPTDLAHRVANPRDDTERDQALYDMMSHIDILQRLENHLNGQTPSGDFWRILTEITDASPKDAREKSDEIKKLYKRLLRYKENAGSNTVSSNNRVEQDTGTSSESSNAEILVKISEDELQLSEITKTNLKMAKVFVESKKNELVGDDSDQEDQDEGPKQAKLG